MENTKKLTATVIALEEPDTLRDRLGCAEWASTESIKIMRSIGTKDIALLSGLAHNSLKCIDLQDAIISNLPEGAFEGCEELESIILPQCTTLPKNIFKGCKSLTNVELQSPLTTIEPFVFSDCTALEQIVLPQNISLIGEKAFYNCAKLALIESKAPYPPICHESSFENISASCQFVIPANHLNDYCAVEYWKKHNPTEAQQ